MSEIILAARDVRKVYKNDAKEVRAVNGITLDIARNRATAIIGPSGAGKSTFLHMLGGLDRPTSGKIEMGGVNIYKLPDKERARIRNGRVGFVFQFYHLLPEFTALENVMMPALIKGPGMKFAGQISRAQGPAIKERARDALHSVGLKDRADHKPGELSGGESQRVAIARALVNEPEVLLCDEPTGNLDSKTSESIYELLFDLQSKHRMTLVIVTHDEGISKKISVTVRLKDGRID